MADKSKQDDGQDPDKKVDTGESPGSPDGSTPKDDNPRDGQDLPEEVDSDGIDPDVVPDNLVGTGFESRYLRAKDDETRKDFASFDPSSGKVQALEMWQGEAPPVRGRL